jgi:alpha-N-arabinofuranosidase
VFLASRIYGGKHYNTGRETYLLPVTWKDGWPTILSGGRAIPQVAPGPAFMDGRSVERWAQQAPMSGNFIWRDEFDRSTLDRAWLQVRVPKRPWFDFNAQPGHLTIQPLNQGLDSLRNPSFLARRQQHLAFESSTALEIPETPGIDAGIAAFQNESHWYFLGVRRKGQDAELFLQKDSGGTVQTVATATLAKPSKSLQLKIVGDSGAYSFAYDAGNGWTWLRQDEDGTVLSTDIAGGFVGAMIGPYARATQDH